MKKQVINHLATDPEESSVTYYVRDANEAVMAIYQQTVFHASGPPGCLRKPNNPSGAPDWENDGVVEIPWSCDNCRLGAVGLIGGEWNPWQEDYDKDGLGDACDACPFQKQPLGAPCTGLPIELPQPEQWTGVATTTKLAELPIYGSERLGLMRPNVLRDTVIKPIREIFTRRVDQKEYELKDHLGNVRVVVSDMKTRVQDQQQNPLPPVTYAVRVKSVNAYYAFGMLEEGMSGSSEGYRYGFNGKESDNEISGTGNQYDYGFRIYNPRLGKFLSVDPLTKDYPELTPYQFASNTPIQAIDLDGLEAVIVSTDTRVIGGAGTGRIELGLVVAWNGGNPEIMPYVTGGVGLGRGMFWGIGGLTLSGSPNIEQAEDITGPALTAGGAVAISKSPFPLLPDQSYSFTYGLSDLMGGKHTDMASVSRPPYGFLIPGGAIGMGVFLDVNWTWSLADPVKLSSRDVAITALSSWLHIDQKTATQMVEYLNEQISEYQKQQELAKQNEAKTREENSKPGRQDQIKKENYVTTPAPTSDTGESPASNVPTSAEDKSRSQRDNTTVNKAP